MAECALRFRSQGIEKLNFSPKRQRDVKSLIIVDPK